jgi:hypothetical protein
VALGYRALQGLQDHKVNLGLKANPVFRANPVLLGLKANLDPKAAQIHYLLV